MISIRNASKCDAVEPLHHIQGRRAPKKTVTQHEARQTLQNGQQDTVVLPPIKVKVEKDTAYLYRRRREEQWQATEGAAEEQQQQ